MAPRITQQEVVVTWYLRALREFLWAFKEDDHLSLHEAYHLTMGLELVCKSYLLGLKSGEYDGKPLLQGMEKVDKLARKIGHDFEKIFKNLRTHLGDTVLDQMLQAKYTGFAGNDLVDVMSKAYLETRYPVPDRSYLSFPSEGGDIHWDPIQSSAIGQFSHEVFRQVSLAIKNDLGVNVPKEYFDSIMHGDVGARLSNVLFNGEPGEYIQFS